MIGDDGLAFIPGRDTLLVMRFQDALRKAWMAAELYQCAQGIYDQAHDKISRAALLVSTRSGVRKADLIAIEGDDGDGPA
jgi:hypothetical protein